MVWQTDNFSQLDHLQEHMERMWHRLISNINNPPQYCPPILEPPVDVYETGSRVVVVVEMAGIDGTEVEITLADNQLTIRGQRQDRHSRPGCHYSQMEICHGNFERTVTLPTAVDPDSLEATYKDGFLEIVLAKMASQPHHRIRITLQP